MPALLLAAAGYFIASFVPGWRSWWLGAVICAGGLVWTAFAAVPRGSYDWGPMFLAAALVPIWIGGAGGLAFRAVSLARPGAIGRRILISGVGLAATALVAFWVAQSL